MDERGEDRWLHEAMPQDSAFGMRKQMDESEFEIGDVVELRSGGPLMTIIGLETKDWAGPEQKNIKGEGIWLQCTWFDKNNENRGDVFPKEALRHTRKEQISQL